MKKILPLWVVSILVLSGLGAAAIPFDEIKTNANMVENEISTISLDDELDQYQTDGDWYIFVGTIHIEIPEENISVNYSVQVAQSFIPQKDALTRVELYVGKNATVSRPYEVAIRDNLTGKNLAEVSVNPDEIPVIENSTWIEFDFDDIQVNVGQTYYIVSFTENVTDNWYLWIASNNSESYPYGCAWVSIGGGNWTNESASIELNNEETWVNPAGRKPLNNDSTWDMCFKTYGRDNQPPNTPTIDGETSGKAGKEYEYTFNAIDPDGDDVKYFIDWGDNNTEWTDFHASGTDVKVKHTWSEEGTYNITAKAKDIYGAEGPESILEVTMPKNKAFNFNSNLLSWLFERFPNTFPILRHILGL